MKRPVLLEAAGGAAAYATLLSELAAAGERAGWLELTEVAARPPAPLEEAAAAGVLRAVSAGAGRVLTVKPIRGAAVVEDLLRGHFRGCQLVLVRGGEGLVRLDREDDGEGWRLVPPAGRPVRQSTAELVSNLRRPSFWRALAEAPAESRPD